MRLRSLVLAVILGSVPAIAMAQLDSPNRKELKRVDLTGAPGKPLYDAAR